MGEMTRTVKEHAVDRLLLLASAVALSERESLARAYVDVGQELQGISELRQTGDALVDCGTRLGKGGLFGFKKKGLSEREREKLRKQLHQLADLWVPRDDPFQSIYYVWSTSGLWAAHSGFLDARGNHSHWKALDSEEKHDPFAQRMALGAAFLHAAMAGVNLQNFLNSQPAAAQLAQHYQAHLAQVKRQLPANFPPNLELPVASALFGFEAFKPHSVSWEHQVDLALVLGACLVEWSNHVQVLAIG